MNLLGYQPAGLGYHRILGRILILTVLLIVYGSLYPWHFAAPQVAPVLHLGGIPLNRFVFRDEIVNIALYLPLGMFGFLWLRQTGLRQTGLRQTGLRPARSAAAAILRVLPGAFALSCLMEFIQIFEPTRNASLLDVATNCAGTAIGIGLGLTFERMAPSPELIQHRFAERGALTLFFVWVGYLTFPWFPTVGLYVPVTKLRAFVHAPLLAPVPFLSACALWFAAGRLLRSRTLVPLLALLPLQFFLVDRHPVPSDFFGAMAGVLLFLITDPARAPRLIEAALFLGVVAFRGLAPFHPVHAANPFNWIPFGGFLTTQWQSGIQVLLEKGFYYGTAIWLFRASGFRFAAVLVAVVLALIEILQIHLPGRTAEITDPVLALLLGFGLTALSRRETESLSPR